MFENFIVPKELIPSDPRFGCGPSLVPEENIKKMVELGTQFMGTSHRKPGVKNVVRDIQEGLKKYFQLSDDYLVCLGNGGATLLWDAFACGAIKKKSSHFTCGEFSGKWFKSSKLNPSIDAEEINVAYGDGINPTAREGSDFIACTLNETSTGVMLSEVPELGDDSVLGMDATSGAAQCAMDVNKVDYFYFSPQKVLASDGGLFINIMSKKGRERVLEINEDKERYIPAIFNWKTIIDNSEKNQTYNTPALSTLLMLRERINQLNEQGYNNVIADGQKRAELLYGWAESKDYLKPYVEKEEFRSTAVATIDVDDKIPVVDLLNVLYEQNVAYNIESYRKLGRNQFRIAMFNQIKFEDLEKLTQLLSAAIESV